MLYWCLRGADTDNSCSRMEKKSKGGLCVNLYDRVDANKAAIDVVRPFEGEMLEQLKAYYRIGLT